MAGLMALTATLALLLGFPVAFTLAGTALIFAFIGLLTGDFSATDFEFLPSRIFDGIMWNETLIAIPVFVFMGVMLERSKIAERLLETMALLFGPIRGGLGISVIVVGTLLAASTGIVGATVVTMGFLSLPTMLKRGYSTRVATGSICASGTLGQIIPPSIVLIILADVLSNAATRVSSQVNVSITDLFIGALIPGLLLVVFYILYIVILGIVKPDAVPAIPESERKALSSQGLWLTVIKVLVPPLVLIVLVLGSILTGVASPTNAAAVGAIGAMVLAIINRQFTYAILKDVMRSTLEITSMVMLILIGATIFTLIFRSYGGDEAIKSFLITLPGGVFSAMLVVMLVIFLLGFIIDFFEITLVVIPIVAPILMHMGVHPVWLGIMIAINLQTSFLTPPFGFSLFYLRGVAPPEVKTLDMYKGVIPFIVIQLLVLCILAYWQDLATWLPEVAEKARKAAIH